MRWLEGSRTYVVVLLLVAIGCSEDERCGVGFRKCPEGQWCSYDQGQVCVDRVECYVTAEHRDGHSTTVTDCPAGWDCIQDLQLCTEGKQGDPCEDDDNCQEHGLVCHGFLSYPVCGPSRLHGESCDDSDDCVDDHYCRGGNCWDGRLGDPCEENVWIGKGWGCCCGYVCHSQLHECTEYGQEGDDCGDEDDCLSSICISGSCSEGTTGDPCWGYSDCAKDYVCNTYYSTAGFEGQCMPLGADGDHCVEDYHCMSGYDCEDNVCDSGKCKPDCSDAQCGDDGCGGSCGDCGKGWKCQNGACIVDCQPDCSGKDCGPDGCGGNCGDCPSWAKCIDGICCDQTEYEGCLGEDIYFFDCSGNPTELSTDCSEFLVDSLDGGQPTCLGDDDPECKPCTPGEYYCPDWGPQAVAECTSFGGVSYSYCSGEGYCFGGTCVYDDCENPCIADACVNNTVMECTEVGSGCFLLLPKEECGDGYKCEVGLAGPYCKLVAGCADGTDEQVYSANMVGCNTGEDVVSFTDKDSLCAFGWHACNLTEFTANGGLDTGLENGLPVCKERWLNEMRYPEFLTEDMCPECPGGTLWLVEDDSSALVTVPSYSSPGLTWYKLSDTGWTGNCECGTEGTLYLHFQAVGPQGWSCGAVCCK